MSDLIEFYAREESPSGVQRVIEGVVPHFLDSGAIPLVFDRVRGVFVPVSLETVKLVLSTHTDRSQRAHLAAGLLTALPDSAPLPLEPSPTIFFPGAVWINDALMLAAWGLAEQGARMVYLLYDLTPVIETGHTAAVNQLFERYLWLVANTGDRVPAISQSSRRDFESWCAARGFRAPAGTSTGLPNGIGPTHVTTEESPWPRPYALMVGTIESRKNHIFALHAWKRLIAEHGADNIPDLICVGRLGWHAESFLDEFVTTRGLNGKVHVLTSSTSDEVLANLYAHAEFTVYPSRYEGWGLPVSEGLAFGKVTISADNSSLPEAGGDLATYFPTDDVDAFISAIQECGLNTEQRTTMEQHIVANRRASISWEDVARQWEDEVRLVAHVSDRKWTVPQPELNVEYMLNTPSETPDGAHADRYLEHLVDQRTTPMLRQSRGEQDYRVTDPMIIGQLGSPQSWGLEIHPNRPITFRFARPVDGPLTLLLATRSMPGRVTIDVVSTGGDSRMAVYLGSVVTIELGDGKAGESATAVLSVVDATDSVEGFLGLRSLVVTRSDDREVEVVALRAQADALRQELDFMTNTRSWRITAPLRRWRGRGSDH